MIGAGILKGMAVTGRNFLGSYFEKDRLTTVQYPEERDILPENSRNFPFLVFDTNDPEAGLRCVACKICEKECPPQCIYIVKSEEKKPDYMGKPQFYPATFDIDISVCMSCQICVEVCPFEAIKMDKVYELSRRERFDALLMRKARPREIERLLSPHPPARSGSGRRQPQGRGREEEAGRRGAGTARQQLAHSAHKLRGAQAAGLSHSAARRMQCAKRPSESESLSTRARVREDVRGEPPRTTGRAACAPRNQRIAALKARKSMRR